MKHTVEEVKLKKAQGAIVSVVFVYLSKWLLFRQLAGKHRTIRRRFGAAFPPSLRRPFFRIARYAFGLSLPEQKICASLRGC